MAKHIIIDGYNLIRQSPDLHELDRLDLEMGRNRLIDMLAAYKRVKAYKITVVFDGGGAPSLSNRNDLMKGIHIRFSHPGETADAVIKRMAARSGTRAFIVSSDREILDYAEKKGAICLTSPEFSKKIVQAFYMSGKGLMEPEDETVERRIGTKKKGPSRRPSKRERRKRLETDKL